jgi:hypothetical protein
VSVRSQRHSEGSSQTKISNFDYPTVLADQQVLRFQVSVQHSSFVAEQHGNHYLQNYYFKIHFIPSKYVAIKELKNLPGRGMT